jgi:hypothetical protein
VKTAGFPVLLVGGAVVGTIDIAYAIGFWYAVRDVAPLRILQSVAAGVLGRDAFSGGVATAALGLGLHYLIATSMVIAYHVAGRRFPVLFERAIPLGLLYGVLLYGFMNHVVIPLSAASRPAFYAPWVLISIAVHAIGIGLPSALFARRAAASAIDGIAHRPRI